MMDPTVRRKWGGGGVAGGMAPWPLDAISTSAWLRDPDREPVLRRKKDGGNTRCHGIAMSEAKM